MPISFFKYIASPDENGVTRFSPSDDLKEYVEGYYFLNTAHFGGRELFFNDGYPVVAFMQTKDKKTRINADGDLRLVGNAWACGGMLRNIYCESPASFDGLFVMRFYPGAFFRLFETGPKLFDQRQVLDFSEIAGFGFEELNNAFYSASSEDQKIEATNRFLSAKVSIHSYPDVLTDVLELIDKQGIQTVKALVNACKARLSYKWLERNFKKHLGVSPQNYLLMRRFLHAYLDLQDTKTKDLLQVALDNGYCDANHFIKDFRKFSGVPPKTYFLNTRTSID